MIKDIEFRRAFQKLLVAQHEAQSFHPVPKTLFDVREQTGAFTWPGLEGRYQDFCAGSNFALKEIKRLMKGVKK